MELVKAISILDGVFSNESTVVPEVLDAWKKIRVKLNAPNERRNATWNEVTTAIGAGNYIDLPVSEAYSLYNYIHVRGGRAHTSHKGVSDGQLRVYYMEATTR